MEANKDLVYVYSIVIGEVYQLQRDEVKNLMSYQIPLTQKPKGSCKSCYGRGYRGIDPNNGLFHPCSCLQKIIDPNFDTRNVTVYMPRLQG